MRLFVALPVAEHVREQLRRGLEPWRSGAHPDSDPGWRWTRPEGWHVTLAFLGEVDAERVGEAADVAGGAVAGAGRVGLSLGKVADFGRRVLHVEIEDEPSGYVRTLGAQVQRTVAAAGLPVKEQRVVPHLTLARARRRTRPALVAPPVPSVAWSVDEARVYRSRLHPEGARYEVVERLPLT